MSAQSIFDHVSIGSIVAWCDGTPRPPERHRRRLAAWQTNNGQGRLIRKQSSRTVGSHTSPASFTLHEADHGGGSVITIRVQRSFQVGSALSFSVIERPTVGSVRIFDGPGPGAELVHLASNRAEAGTWLQHHGYPRAVLDEVTGGEAASGTAEGSDAA